MNVEKLLELYQEKVLPFVVHLETKERTKLFKALEKGEKVEVVSTWKELLKEKGVNSDNVVKDYLTYVNGLKELDEESLKKLKNKNTYFLRKNTDVLVEKFNELKVEVKVVEVKEELVSEEVLTSAILFKGRMKKKKKDVKKNKNAKRKKKNRGKKNK